MLSIKLGIQTPLSNNSTNNQQAINYELNKLELKMKEKINKLKTEFEHQMHVMTLQLKHNTEMNELKCKLHHMEIENNRHKHMSTEFQQKAANEQTGTQILVNT